MKALALFLAIVTFAISGLLHWLLFTDARVLADRGLPPWLVQLLAAPRTPVAPPPPRLDEPIVVRTPLPTAPTATAAEPADSEPMVGATDPEPAPPPATTLEPTQRPSATPSSADQPALDAAGRLFDGAVRADIQFEFDVADEPAIEQLSHLHELPFVLVDTAQQQVYLVTAPWNALGPRVPGPTWRLQPLPSTDDRGRRLRYGDWLDKLRPAAANLGIRHPQLALLLPDDRLEVMAAALLREHCERARILQQQVTKVRLRPRLLAGGTPRVALEVARVWLPPTADPVFGPSGTR